MDFPAAITMHDTLRRKTRLSNGLQLAAVPLCAWLSFWLYRIIERIVPRMGSAEPTGASQVFPWVKAMTHDTLDSIQHKTYGQAYTLQYMACCAGLLVLYAIIVWLARGRQPRLFLAMAVISAAAFMGSLLCTPAMLSSDTYAYAHYGRLRTLGMDAHSPAAIAKAGTNAGDPFSLDGYYDFVPSVYGPFWTVISAGLVLAAHGHVGLTILLFRALEAACALGSAGFIWLILNRLAPEHAAQGTLLFLWNPLVVMESVLGGHNDTCMMFLALLAVWLHLRGWKAGAVTALIFSALVKVITLPLVPLYVLMVIRSSPRWKESALFVLRAGLGTMAAIALSVLGAKMKPDGLIGRTASSAQFYENNYHEPLFKAVRRMLGEPAESIEIPMDFRTWWVRTSKGAVLHEGISNKSKDQLHLEPGHALLAISDEDSDVWLRLYDPVSHLEGYIDWSHLYVVDDPPDADRDPIVQRISGWPPDWPTVIEANRIIRVTTWSLFVAFGLLAAWKTKDLDTFLLWGTGFFIAAQLLVFTKIWPWYVIWPMAYGALKPRSGIARLAAMLSGGGILLYALLDFTTTRWDWLYDYRSIPTIVAPVVLFAVLKLWEIFRRGNRGLAIDGPVGPAGR